MSAERRMTTRSAREPAVAPPVVHQVLRSPGQPLDASTRAFMEPRFGHDFGQVQVHAQTGTDMNIVPASDRSEMEAARLSDSLVRRPAGPSSFDFSRIRIHADGAAGESARAIGALAYTAGRHIVFGEGQYRPGVDAGRRLLAHELVHTVQQSAGGGVVQRQDAKGDAPVTARAIFPYPEKSRLLVNLLLSDMNLDMIAGYMKGDPDSATALGILRAAEGKIATVKTATDDLFEAVVPSVTLAAQGNASAQTVKDATLRLSRQADGTFQFAIAGDAGAGSKELLSIGNITAKKEGGGFRLSVPNAPMGASARIAPGSKPGQVEVVGDVSVLHISALQLTQLPDAPPGSETEKKVVEEVSKAAKSQRRERRQQATAGVGVQAAAGVDPVFMAAWSIGFTPSVKVGDLVQIPLRVRVDYAPDKSIVGGVSSGVGVNIPSKVPVNLRVDAGWAAGAIRGVPAAGGGKGAYEPATGPTFGAGVGIALGKTVRVEVDYQHLQNLVQSGPPNRAGARTGGPNADTVVAGVGVAF